MFVHRAITAPRSPVTYEGGVTCRDVADTFARLVSTSGYGGGGGVGDNGRLYVTSMYNPKALRSMK